MEKMIFHSPIVSFDNIKIKPIIKKEMKKYKLKEDRMEKPTRLYEYYSGRRYLGSFTYPYGLKISVRTFNCLRSAGVESLKDLLNLSEEDLSKVKNLGKITMLQIKKELADIGLKLKEVVYYENLRPTK